MDRSVRYVACLVLGVVFAAAMSRPAPAPVATLAGGFASQLAAADPLWRRAGLEANACPAPHRRGAGSDAAKDVG
jgi:hypothetical protein